MRWTPKFCRISAVPSRREARLKACSMVANQSSASNEIDLEAKQNCSVFRWLGALFIDGWPVKNGDFPWQTVVITRWYTTKKSTHQSVENVLKRMLRSRFISKKYGLFQVVSIKIGVQCFPNEQGFKKYISYHNDFSGLRSNVPLRNQPGWIKTFKKNNSW